MVRILSKLKMDTAKVVKSKRQLADEEVRIKHDAVQRFNKRFATTQLHIPPDLAEYGF